MFCDFEQSFSIQDKRPWDISEDTALKIYRTCEILNINVNKKFGNFSQGVWA